MGATPPAFSPAGRVRKDCLLLSQAKETPNGAYLQKLIFISVVHGVHGGELGRLPPPNDPCVTVTCPLLVEAELSSRRVQEVVPGLRSGH